MSYVIITPKSTIPTELSDGNTVAWYSSDASTTLTLTVDGSVSRWNDILGSGHDLIQNTGTKQPKWTSDGILFDGIDNFMATDSFSYIQPEMIYVVLKQITWTANRTLFDGLTGSSGQVLQTTTTPGLKAYAGTLSAQNNNLSLDTFGIVRALFNGVNSKLQINSTAATTGNFGTPNMDGFTLGAYATGSTYYSNIQVKEIILRNVADTGGAEDNIYNYLSNKYLGTNLGTIYLTLSNKKLIYTNLLNGLQLYYKMDGSLGYAKDYSIYNRDASIVGVVQDASGIINDGFLWNYDSVARYVRTPSFSIPGNQLSLNIWTIPVADQANLHTLIGDAAQSATTGFIWFYRSAGTSQLTFQRATGVVFGGIIYNNYFTGFVGTWVMVTITADYDNGIINWYRNGQLLRTDSNLTMLAPTTNRVKYIGNYGNTGNYPWNSNMDEVGMWSRVLSQYEITRLYNSGIGKSHPFDFANPGKFKLSANTPPAILNDGNTVAWYDYYDLSNVTKTVDGSVSLWKDKLGSGHDLIQATGNAQPQWTSNGILFDGVNDYLKTAAFTWNQPEMIYMVVNQIIYTTNDIIFDGNISYSGTIGQGNISGRMYQRLDASFNYVIPTSLAYNSFKIIRCTWNTISTLRINEADIFTYSFMTSPNMGAFTLARLGSSAAGWANMQVKEIILRNVVDTSTNETAIYNYLNKKYNIAAPVTFNSIKLSSF